MDNKEMIFVTITEGIGFYYEEDDGSHGEPETSTELEVSYE